MYRSTPLVSAAKRILNNTENNRTPSLSVSAARAAAVVVVAFLAVAFYHIIPTLHAGGHISHRPLDERWQDIVSA